jgi:hypothetical protein
MPGRFSMVACALAVAGAALVACGEDVRADAGTIQACERWDALREQHIATEDRGEVGFIAREATDPAVSRAASALAAALELDFTGTLVPQRSARLDQACESALG